jgi:glycosyltransferase involved in cell wall biosynthesis
MRVLLLSVTNPVPANNGVKMRTWSILRALAAEGHEVVLLVFADPHEPVEHPPELSRTCARVICVPHRLKSLSSSRDYIGRAKHLFSDVPYATEASRSPEMEKQLRQLLGDGSINVILSEQTDLLVNLAARPAQPLVVDFHNVDYLIYERYLRLERNPAKRFYAWLEGRKSREWERRSCRMATVAMACSGHDRIELQQLNPALPLFVVPNVVDVDEYEPRDTEDPRKILFQGGMDWYPNRDAVEFFVAETFPLIRKRVPDARFVIAGRNPPEEFRKRLSLTSGVEFTGTVPDMRAQIADAAVCVVPLRVGSGTRLKILESAAMAKPIISTHLGAEGLEFVNGDEIMLEDDPSTFAAMVVRLLSAPDLRRLLGRAARRRVELDYSFRALSKSLCSAMSAVTPNTATDQTRGMEPR